MVNDKIWRRYKRLLFACYVKNIRTAIRDVQQEQFKRHHVIFFVSITWMYNEIVIFIFIWSIRDRSSSIMASKKLFCIPKLFLRLIFYSAFKQRNIFWFNFNRQTVCMDFRVCKFQTSIRLGLIWQILLRC